MKDKCIVTNKSAGRVVYNLKEDHIRREFYPHQSREIAVAELEKLAQIPGGLRLLYNYLMVDDPEVIEYLVNGEVAPEYWITEKELPNWMQTCKLEEFQDALDFAPEGTKDLIKQYAVSLPLNDYSKRQAIKDQLGFDVTVAIENNKEDEPQSATKAPERRVTQSTGEEQKRRRVVTVTE